MARPRNIIPRIVGIDMVELASKILKMSDAEKAAWLTKAVSDCIEGCSDPNCDPFIRVQFERSLAQMRSKQEIDAQTYKNRLARQGKTPQEPTADSSAASANGAYNTPTRESETRGPQTDNNLAESATRTSEAVKALADGDIREDSLNIADGSNAAQPESGASAKTFVTTTEATTPSTISTDGPRQAEARQSRGTGSDSLRGTKQPESHSGKDSVLLPAEPKKPYGTCGHVMLTDAEGRTLRETYGKHLAIAIDILDAYGENNPKKFAKYKNHAAVLRKGNWVYNKILEMKDKELRLNNAKKQGDRRSFAQKDRDDRSNWLTHSMFELPEAANG